MEKGIVCRSVSQSPETENAEGDKGMAALVLKRKLFLRNINPRKHEEIVFRSILCFVLF
jgi:hypothetical protein